MADWVRRWLEDSPYARALGVRVESLGEERARLALPFQQESSNGDGALHGGVAASLIALGGHAVARRALGEASGPWYSAALHTAYLSAALREGIAAEARLLRRGKELAYADVEVQSDSGKAVARGLVTVRGRLGAAREALPPAAGDRAGSDRGPLGAFFERLPFHARLGLAAEHMAGGRARVAMPWRDANADASGGVHEGAVLALLDTTGAMAAWAETGPGRYKASTPGIQASFLAPPERCDLLGFGHVRHRDRELLHCEVEIARAADGALLARGTVHYRSVAPEPAR